ncbi:MAG: hypothetical protein DCC55_16435 [Chloroflexi bacterium]|nr:MAG: hypothetical protein DCC55_16435 [Chloroflexota bacterium]
MMRTVIHFTDSAGFGGAEQMLLHLLAGLDRRQWRPVLFHHAEPGLAPLLEGARSLGVDLQPVPRLPLGRQGALLAPRLARTLRSWRPAVFHAHLTWLCWRGCRQLWPRRNSLSNCPTPTPPACNCAC